MYSEMLIGYVYCLSWKFRCKFFSYSTISVSEKINILLNLLWSGHNSKIFVLVNKKQIQWNMLKISMLSFLQGIKTTFIMVLSIFKQSLSRIILTTCQNINIF